MQPFRCIAVPCFVAVVLLAAAATGRAEDRAVPAPHTAISDRLTEARLGPLHAALTLVDGRLLRHGRRQIALELANRSETTVAGEFRILNTAAWQITPGTAFVFTLGPGERLFQDFQASLPAYVSPGHYDFVVRVMVEGRELGSLRATLVKPIDWVVVGPFAPPGIGESLEPETGVNLDGVLHGLNGRVVWRSVPDYAFDASGRLELDLVFGAAETARCACAFSVFDAAQTEALRWYVDGVDAILLNGQRLEPGNTAQVRRGRNTVLVRSCDRDGSWRLGLALLGRDGTWVRGLDNDLATLLDGFDAVGRTQGSRGGANRQWLVEYHNPSARAVSILGSFNGWVPLELTRSGDGTWRRDLLLAPGRYAYKLSIDGHLDLDPSADRVEPDGFGGQNSVLIVR